MAYGSSEHTIKSTAIKSGQSAVINFYKPESNSKSKPSLDGGAAALCFMSSEGKQKMPYTSDGRFGQIPSSFKSKESGRRDG